MRQKCLSGLNSSEGLKLEARLSDESIELQELSSNCDLKIRKYGADYTVLVGGREGWEPIYQKLGDAIEAYIDELKGWLDAEEV